MTLHQLRIFECVVNYGNITKASSTLRLSQPSVSQQLKLLEEEFGKKFLARRTQGVELTADGKEFLEAARPILVGVANLEKRFKQRAEDRYHGRLIVGGSSNLSVQVLPKLIRAFRLRHPAVQFVLETSDSASIEKRLLTSELTVALITNPSYHSGILYEPYDRIDVVAFCHPTNPLAGKRMSLKDLVKCPLVLRRGGRTERLLTELSLEMNIALRCDLSSTVKAAVRTGMGVGILYRNAVASRLARGDLRLINVTELAELGLRSFIAYSSRKPLTPTGQAFLDMVRERRNRTIGASSEAARMVSRTPAPLHSNHAGVSNP
jgi:DNA-binding transcriptional LysR family regulator